MPMWTEAISTHCFNISLSLHAGTDLRRTCLHRDAAAHKVVSKRAEKRQYLYDDKALEEYKKSHARDFTLQRYKVSVRWMRISSGERR